MNIGLGKLEDEMKENDLISNVKVLLARSKTKQEGCYKLAEFFLQKLRILTFQDTDEVFIYNDGVYEGGGDKKIASEIEELLGELSSIHIINELLAHIRRFTYKRRDDIIEPKDKICLQNGILNLKTLTVEPHSPNTIFFNKISVDHNPEVDCLKIKKFLSEIVSEDDIKVLQEIAGYCLYKGYPIHKAFMLVGGGANGKSTFIRLLKEFLTQINCSSVPLQNFENNRFAMAQLFGKLANMFADLPARALRDTSFFKMLTGEDLIPAEKKFKDGFSFMNYAKMIFSCNQIPRSPDDSDAFFRRWVIINFPNQFMGENADNKLVEKLATSEELSGFLNFALEGLKRLLEKGDFSNSKSIMEVREQYIRQSDSVGAFVMDCILIAPDDHIEKKTLYTQYADYCRERSYPIVPENTFHRQLQAQIRVEDYRPRIDGHRVQCWKGIKYNVNDVNENSHLSDKRTEQQTNIKLENNPDNVDKADTDVKDVSDVKVKSHLSDSSKPSNDDLIMFVKESMPNGYDMNEFSEKYGEDRMRYLMKIGELYEMKSGVLGVLE